MTGEAATISNQEYLRQFLAGKGEGPAQIAGIEANVTEESGFDTNSYNASENAHGWLNWEGGRWPALKAWAAALHLPWNDRRAQASYLWHELNTGYAGALAAMNATNDPGEVARIFDVGKGGQGSGTGVENSAGTTTQDRIDKARSIYAELASGAPLTGTTTGAGAGGADTYTAAPANFPGGAFDPLNWPSQIAGAAGNAAGAAAGGVLKVVLPFVTKAAFVVGGLGLVIVGMYRASEPARETVKEGRQEAAKALPIAAAV